MKVISLQKFLKIITAIFFVVGISLVGYSLFQIWYGNKAVEDSLNTAKEIVKQAKGIEPANMSPEELMRLKKEAESITFDNEEIIGVLSVPKLEKELPIVEGTDEDDLGKGVGHYTGTALPLQNSQILLSGHRDTVFRGFDKLTEGDTFVVHMPYGSFEYEIFKIEIVPADDTTVIGRYDSEENLTVTTCYPFHYIGNAPDRAVFFAKPTFDTTALN